MFKRNSLLITLLRGGLTVAFLWFGLTKLLGTPDAVALYEALGFGQVPRYITGSVETFGAVALWIPGVQGLAALALTVTMAIGLSAMLFIIGGPWWHLALLLVLSAVLALAFLRRSTPTRPQTLPSDTPD